MFVGFLIAANVKCLYILALSSANLALVSIHQAENLSQAIATTPASLVLIVFCTFVLCTVGSLCSYHVGVMMDDTTTRMNIKHIARGSDDAVLEGGCGNLWRRLCTSSIASYFPSHPENWFESTPESAAAAFEAMYGPRDIDSIKRRIDLERSNIVLTVSQMQVLFFATAKQTSSAAQSDQSSPIVAAPALPRLYPASLPPNIPSAGPPLPSCEEVDAVTRCTQQSGSLIDCAHSSRNVFLAYPFLNEFQVRWLVVPGCRDSAFQQWKRTRPFLWLGRRIQRGALHRRIWLIVASPPPSSIFVLHSIKCRRVSRAAALRS
jgi:hypothetical protein